MLEDVVAGARFFFRLPSFLRHPLTVDEARATLRRRLERREADFLTLVRRTIYEYNRSPYRQLLKVAGCEYGDLEGLVNQEGVEGALEVLFRHGVHLTVDEFKGRRPVVRGSASLAVDPSRFRNPLSAFHVPVHSGGSRGEATLVPMDLAAIREHAVNECLALRGRGGAEWVTALWGVPGSATLRMMLRCSICGVPPIRWFSQVDLSSRGLHPRYPWSARVLRWGSLMARVPLPLPVHVPIEDPLPIIRWMTDILRHGRTPHLTTYGSAAVRLCQVALAHGIDLTGAEFLMTGEPITRARIEGVRRAGGNGVAAYASMESGGRIGYGCLASEMPDEVHFFQDLHAVIQPGCEGERLGIPAQALFLSSLRATAPMILLNVSTGDQALIVQRTCGCPLERTGWSTHLHTISSYEKLTAGGMAFLDTDVIRVLEEILPARFGGGPTDYQLVEEEAKDGQPRLRLLVHPRVGPLDAAEVAEAFLTAISPGSGAERVMGLVWRHGQFLRIERRPPLATPSGKILHLHVDRSHRSRKD